MGVTKTAGDRHHPNVCAQRQEAHARTPNQLLRWKEKQEGRRAGRGGRGEKEGGSEGMEEGEGDEGRKEMRWG